MMTAAAPTDAAVPARASSRIVVTDGTIEALKWLGLALMTLDHVNKYLLADRLAWAFALGRLTMPIFGFVLAYNLARPGALASGLHARMARRLALAALAATPFFLALGGLAAGWWPLNILFALLTAVGLTYLIERGGLLRLAGALALFLVAGALVEFWWYGLAFILAAWWYCRTTTALASALALSACAVALLSLVMANRNMWALAALPLFLLAPKLSLRLPRSAGRVFYAYYPIHLAALLAVRHVL